MNTKDSNELTYDRVKGLGWIDRHPRSSNEKGKGNNTFKFGDYIMGVLWNWDEDFHDIIIKDVEGVNVNVWENGEDVFRGFLKTVDDLYRVMQFVGVTEYKL